MQLTIAERVELSKRTNARSVSAEDARRVGCILLLADGHTPGRRCETSWGATTALFRAGAHASSRGAWPVCSADTRAAKPERSPRRWKRASWSAPDKLWRMARRVGACASWPKYSRLTIWQ